MARGTDSETNDVTGTTDDTTKIVHMTQGQLQSMLENVFTLSMSKMKDYADAISTKADQKLSDAVAALEAKITTAATEHISEGRINEIISSALADADIPVVHTVAFNANGGTLTSVASMKVLDGGLIPEVPNPTHGGRVFVGWWINTAVSPDDVASLGTVTPPSDAVFWDFGTSKVTSDIVLMAKWSNVVVV